jgi:hypothetical protein
MHEMNCIDLSRTDYRAISRSALVPTFARGAVEHNQTQAEENCDPIVDDLIGLQLEKEKEWGKEMGFVDIYEAWAI